MEGLGRPAPVLHQHIPEGGVMDKVLDLDEHRLDRKMNLTLAELFTGPWAFTVEDDDGSIGEPGPTPEAPGVQDRDD